MYTKEKATAGDILQRNETPPLTFQMDYWCEVARTLREVFGVDAGETLDKLREQVEKAKPDTQTAFYHAEPFDVAADLAGRHGESASLEAKRLYVERILRPARENTPDELDLARLHPEH